jgi:hypothetical protein
MLFSVAARGVTAPQPKKKFEGDFAADNTRTYPLPVTQ